MSVQFEFIWKKKSSLRDQAIKLWKRFNTFSSDEVTGKRAEEIVAVALLDGEIVGVSTVRPLQVKLLNNNFFFELRIFVSPENRNYTVVKQLSLKTKKFLEESSDSNSKRCIGIIAVIENKKMKRKFNFPVWPLIDMVLVGYTPKGDHIRVSYFTGAHI